MDVSEGPYEPSPRYSIRKEDERILLVADSIANQSGPWVKWADVAALLPPQEEPTA